MKHRQRPQIDRVQTHTGFDGIGVAHERCAAVVINHALGIAGRARRVVERDRVPFI